MAGITDDERTIPVTVHMTPRLRKELAEESEAKGIPLSRLVRERILAPGRREMDLTVKLQAATERIALLEADRKAKDALLEHYANLLRQLGRPTDGGNPA